MFFEYQHVKHVGQNQRSSLHSWKCVKEMCEMKRAFGFGYDFGIRLNGLLLFISFVMWATNLTRSACVLIYKMKNTDTYFLEPLMAYNKSHE